MKTTLPKTLFLAATTFAATFSACDDDGPHYHTDPDSVVGSYDVRYELKLDGAAAVTMTGTASVALWPATDGYGTASKMRLTFDTWDYDPESENEIVTNLEIGPVELSGTTGNHTVAASDAKGAMSMYKRGKYILTDFGATLSVSGTVVARNAGNAGRAAGADDAGPAGEQGGTTRYSPVTPNPGKYHDISLVIEAKVNVSFLDGADPQVRRIKLEINSVR